MVSQDQLGRITQTDEIKKTHQKLPISGWRPPQHQFTATTPNKLTHALKSLLASARPAIHVSPARQPCQKGVWVRVCVRACVGACVGAYVCVVRVYVNVWARV